MKLTIFDIDGTLLDSVKADDACFIQAFKDLHQIDLGKANWNDFTHVTDSGLSQEVFEKYLNRPPHSQEIESFKSHFYQLLSLRTNEFTPVPGALDYLRGLDQQKNHGLAFATGGWRHTALLKARAVQLPLEKFILKTADDHIARDQIIEAAIWEAKKQYGQDSFENITYFGDGLWDLRTTKKLGIDFIGVDHHQTGELLRAGAKQVIQNFSQLME